MKMASHRFFIGSALTTLTLSPVAASADPQAIELWRHRTANTAEIEYSREAALRFNQSQDRWHVEMDLIPEGSYTETIAASALASDLPCVMYIDQPVVPNFAWSGFLQPLNGLLDQAVLNGLIETAKGTYKEEVYSVGQYEAALALFARRSVLERYGIRIATMDKPWDENEFRDALSALKKGGEYQYPLDIQAGETGEWYSYAFSPWLKSFGADQIDRSNYLEAEGVLNGENAVEWGEFFQWLFENKYVDRNPTDSKGFDQGRVAIKYAGSWEMKNHVNAWEDDLVVMPVPDFGHGPVIGGGSWQLGVTSSCKYPQGAKEFLEFMLKPEEVAKISEATSLIPTSATAAALTERYREGGGWRFFYDFSDAYAMQRPATPAYPIISSSFERAARDIRDGGDVQRALDEAVDSIERNISDNQGYGFSQ
jgi:multiple sugar transport system substrate-binding protein